MTSNHPSAPAPSGLSAIEQIIADLLFKYNTEDKRGSELERLVTESRSRKNSLGTTISNLKREYGLLDKPNPIPALIVPTNLTPSSDITVSGPSANGIKPETPSFPVVKREWVRPNNISWIDLIVDLIKTQDNLINNQEVPKLLNMDDEAKKKHHQTISGTFAYYRNMEQLVGIQVYQRTPNGRAVPQYFNGIPEFFDDIEKLQLKPQYQTAFKDKISKSGFFLTEEEAILT